jgi:prepilin-type N-terminal cleavage/methylation domain-containing protein
MNKKGFTLIELLAVIVILGIILAISTPAITGVIAKSTRNAFAADAKMIIKAIDQKQMTNSAFNPVTTTVENIESDLAVSDDNFAKINVLIYENIIYTQIEGRNKWDDLIACGTYMTMIVVDNIEECTEVMPPPVDITFNYMDNVQEWTVPYAGRYKLEVWGARGGGFNSLQASGGYATGEINLNHDIVLYIHTGGRGINTVGGYNGGGNGGIFWGGTWYGGGGASDVRSVGGLWNNAPSLASRIIIAGGGGGAWYRDDYDMGSDGYGGGLVGGNYVHDDGTANPVLLTGATQTAGGDGSHCDSNNGTIGSGGLSGGGGYFGGACGGGGSGYYGGVINDGTRSFSYSPYNYGRVRITSVGFIEGANP